MMLTQSNTFDENILDTTNAEHLIDKIKKLENYQKNLKQSIIKVDVALKSPNMNYRQQILSKSLAEEKYSYQMFLYQYKQLNAKDRRPYIHMARKFKDKIIEHEEEANLAPLQQIKKLESQREVWFENQQIQEAHWKFMLRGIIGLLGALTLHLLIGATGRWAIVNPYITSYYKITADPYIQTKYEGIGSPLMMFCTGLTMKWGFRRCNQFGPIKILLLAVLGLAGSIFVSGFMPDIGQFLLTHNVFYGFFAGIMFISPMKQCTKYFPNYRLICNSIILSGTGLGAVLFGYLNTSCMNPNHQKPTASGYFSGQQDLIARNLPLCLFEMGFYIIGIGIIGCCMLYPLVEYNSQQQKIKLQKGYKQDFQYSCYTDEQALKSLVFWVLVLLIICSSLGNFYMVTNYKNFVKVQKDEIFKNEDYLMLVVLCGAFCNGFFRLFWGIGFRNIGFKYLLITSLSLNILIFGCLISIDINQYSYFILYTLGGINLGGLNVIYPNACLLIFGDIIGQSIYGFYWAVFSLTNFFQYLWGSHIPQITSFIKENMHSNLVPSNPLKLIFYPCIIMCCIGLVLCVFTKFQGRWQNSLKLLQLKCS